MEAGRPVELRLLTTFEAERDERPESSWTLHFCVVSAVAEGADPAPDPAEAPPPAPMLEIEAYSTNRTGPAGARTETLWIADLDTGAVGLAGGKDSGCHYVLLQGPSSAPPLLDEVVVGLTLYGAASAEVEWEAEVTASGHRSFCEGTPDSTVTLDQRPFVTPSW